MALPSRRLLQDSLLRSGEDAPDRNAVVDESGGQTYEAVLGDALRIAKLLQNEGLRPGDRVALHLDNTARCAAAIFGTLIAGGVFIVVNAQTKAEKLAFVLTDSGATFLLAEGHAANVAAEALAQHGGQVRVFATRTPSGMTALPSLDEALAATDPRPASPGTAPDDLAALVYTSGSTGRRRGVMLSHQALVFVIDRIAEYLRLDADDRILSVLPLAFTYGLSQLLVTTRLGATLLLERTFAFPGRTLERMHTEQATVFPAVPTVYATLVGLEHSRTYDSVRCLTNAAAGLPPAFHEGIRRVFPRARLYRMYGQTECVRVCYLEPELIDSKPTSVGRAIPGTEVSVLDESGKPVAPGKTGVLYVSGPHLMMGYWRDPESTKRSLKEGILSTHDHFTVDEDGLLYFVGRTDDIIKTRGEKVSAIEVENVLHSVDGVRLAAVVGVEDELLGEAVVAYVVLEGGSVLTPEAILRFARAKLENFMVPREVVIVDELPLTESGKVRKRSLLEDAATLARAETPDGTL